MSMLYNELESQCKVLRAQGERPQSINHWISLAYTLYEITRKRDDLNAPAATAEIGGKKYDSNDCYVKAISIDGHGNALAWYNLGIQLSPDSAEENEGKVVIPGQSGGTGRGGAFLQRDCFIRSLSLDVRNSDAWSSLGALLRFPPHTVTIPMVTSPVDEKQCYIRALEIDTRNATGWYNLGAQLGCGGNVLPFGRNSYNTGSCDTITVSGKRYTEKMCYVQALEANERYYLAWTAVGLLLLNEKRSTHTMKTGGGAISASAGNSDLPTVSIKTALYNASQCFVRALELCPRDIEAWCGLSAALKENNMRGNVTVQIEGKAIDAKRSAIIALQLNSSMGEAWSLLAATLSSEEKVTIDDYAPPGEAYAYSKMDALILALQFGIVPQSSVRGDAGKNPVSPHTHYMTALAWLNLALELKAGAKKSKSGSARTSVKISLSGLPKEEFDCKKSLVRCLSHAVAAHKVMVDSSSSAAECLGTIAAAWGHLGEILGPGDTVQVDGKVHDAASCRALGLGT